MEAREAVAGAFRAVFPDHREALTDETAAVDVAGWDSFSHVQFMFEVETRIGREIEITETYELENIGALIRFLGED